jgi:NAD(P)-dependent dehydrogenase (short-subunit alcohol dehydrogenase family)
MNVIGEIEKTGPAADGLQSLANKRILVTGGTKGIGRATVQRLLALNARVLFFARHEEGVHETLRVFENAGGECFGLAADQAQGEDVDRVFREVDQRLGGLDVLINNAAVSSENISEASRDEWVYAVQANLIGYMMCAEAAIERLRQNENGGHIVCVGSMSAKLREEGSEVYVATKSGIRGFTDSLAKRMADDNVNVTLIEPGLVATPLTETPPDEMNEKLQKMEMILSEDIAGAIVFALSQPTRASVHLLQMRPIMQKI